MAFVLRLPLTDPLNLATRHRVAYLFICSRGYGAKRGEPPCATFFENTGANRLVLQASASDDLTPPPPERTMLIPPTQFHLTPPRTEDPVHERAMRDRFMAFISAGLESHLQRPGGTGDSAITVPGDLEAWYAENQRKDVLFLGGEPDWVQNPDPPSCPRCNGGVSLLAQLETFSTGAESTDATGSSGVWLPFEGRCYLFRCRDECCDEGAAMWQTT